LIFITEYTILYEWYAASHNACCVNEQETLRYSLSVHTGKAKIVSYFCTLVFQCKSTNMKPTKKVAFYTLGCKLNFSETSTIARDFEKENFQRVDFSETADVYVINTCSVT